MIKKIITRATMIALLLFLCSSAFAYNWNSFYRGGPITADMVKKATVATLPADAVGRVFVITDGASASDCTVGGGATVVFCWNDGTDWTAVGSGGSTPGGSDTQMQYNDGGAALGGIATFIWDDTNIEVTDDQNFAFGTAADWKIQYDEAVDDQLLIQTTNTASIATTDPMFEILVGTTPTADQQVFGVAKGTQSSNTPLMTVDEDGDLICAATGTFASTVSSTSGGLIVGSGADQNEVIWTVDRASTDVVMSWDETNDEVDINYPINMGGSGNSITFGNDESIDNVNDDYVEFQGGSGTDDTDIRVDLDGTHPIWDSPTDASIGFADPLITVGITDTGVNDFGGATSFEIPNAAAPTVDATGKMGVDTDLITQGMAQIYLTSALANIVATTDAPGDNEVPTYDAGGGTVQWEAAGAGAGAFSDAADPIVQNTITKDVHIGDGAGTLTGKVEIGGDADQPQLVIEGHSTQTDSIVIVQNDADTEVLTISNTGALSMNGALTVNNDNGYYNRYIRHNGDTDTYFEFQSDLVMTKAGGYTFISAVESTTDEVVVNDGSEDINFRVESNANTNAFRVDAGAETAVFNVPMEIYNSTALPATCNVGTLFHDTDSDDCADTGSGDGALCICKTADTWALISNF